MTKEERQKLIKQYADGYAQVAAALESFPADKLSAHLIPNKWSAREIVQHLADSEMRAAMRLRQLLAEDAPIIAAYDQEQYAARLRYNERDMSPALEAFRGARETTAQLLDMMSDADWQRAGWHTESGLYTPETWLAIYAAHAHNHAAQIQKLKEICQKN
jgi:hypothetical protein